jgi:CHAD domain-containing protein
MGPIRKWIDAIDPDASVCDAARRSLEARLMAVVHFLPLAAYHADQDSEHVHRLRVSTRRAGAALKLYDDWLPRKRARWVTKWLKKIRRTAGEARDLDVLAGRLQHEQGERAGDVIDIVSAKRAEVQPEIVRIAARLRAGDKFVRKTAKLIESVRMPKGDSASRKPPVFRDWAAEQLAGLAEEFFAAMPEDVTDMAALHQFRIQGKRLRYAMELVSSAFGPQLRKVQYPLIEQLQQRLGDINDRVTARDRLRTWAGEDSYREQKPILCELAEHEVARLADALRDFRDWWTPSVAERLSHDLAHSA